MKKLFKISLQFFGDPDPTTDPTPDPTPDPTLAQITAEYDRKVKELEAQLKKANDDLKASTDALNRIIDNRTDTATADAVTSNIKKLLR